MSSCIGAWKNLSPVRGFGQILMIRTKWYIAATGLMVGAVGIENNTDWHFKDLEETSRSAKALKRNDRESNGILIGPSMAPRFFRVDEIPSWWVSRPLP